MNRLLPWVLMLAACRTAAPVAGPGAPVRTDPLHETRFTQRPGSDPGFPARALMDVCWPREAVGSAARVSLQLFLKGTRLQDVIFQVDGASNAVGRCMREVALSYPWERAGPPQKIEVPAPLRPPDGLVVLAFARLLTEGTRHPDAGLIDAAGWVRSCMAQGMGVRPSLHYVVETNPVRVHAPVATDSERCVAAVLGSTLFPGSGRFLLAFSEQRSHSGVEPVEVSAYFPGIPQQGVVDPSALKEAVAGRAPHVSACWNALLARRPGHPGGARTLRLDVAADGSLVRTVVAPNLSDAAEELNDLLLDRCLGDALRGMRVANPSGRPATALYSWVFAQR